MPNPLPFLLVGGVLAAAAIAVLAVMIDVALRGESIDAMFPTVAERVPRASIPASILLFAGCALFLGEMFRRARWEFREITLRTAGMTTMRIRTLPLWAVMLWSLLPLTVWMLLVPLPVAFVRAGSDPSDDLWLISLLYGFVAAGFWGIFVVSMVKRLAYARGRVSTAGARELRFWRIASVQWRIESWFGFLAGGLAGLLPLSLADVRTTSSPVEPGAVGLLALIAGALAIVALALACASPRSGYVEGVAESVI
ncbi:hypothetical protein [Lacisediminihabitans sp.]|jgi:hypothetical protein|uniref:hypothetical protein n=1 Tax=Lacisediminihabitans sp. TaxID=2787631 RepID=UPI002F944D7F